MILSVSSAIFVFLRILLLILILGIIILIHEFGHFFWAKKFGVHIYEFSIGMGPLMHGHKGKDGINYNIRWIPIGGYVSMAGEVYDDDDKVKKSDLMCNKKWWQRLIILVAGVFNNFVSAILFLILFAAIWGVSPIKPVVDSLEPNTPAALSNLQAGDQILRINGERVGSLDKAQIVFVYKTKDEVYDFEVKHPDGKIETVSIKPEVKKLEGGLEQKYFGIYFKSDAKKTFFSVIGYGFQKFGAVFDSMICTLKGLITGKISLNALSGPVGMYQVVDNVTKLGLENAISNIIYLIALLSINVGLINILPFPAFDGGHVLFILIEKIKGSPVNAKFENTCHLIGFALIFLLMIIVTINDIIKLF